MRKILLMAALLYNAGAAAAQTPSGREPICIVDGVQVPAQACGLSQQQPNPDPFARYLFPPELVMAHQQAINLTDRQRAAIQEAMKDAQGKFVDLQFRMSADGEKLQELVRGTSVDEARVLEQVDRVLALEREIKRAQLTLMMRIKNQLTEQQQSALTKLRGSATDGRTRLHVF
jgi:hypothetical protein